MLYCIYLSQDVNEQNRWVSAIRKACLTNRDMVPVYHPGAFKNGKWTCCRTPASQGTVLVCVVCIHDLLVTCISH